MANPQALIVGASGIVGQNLAQYLVDRGDWEVYGLSRRPLLQDGVHPVAADLLESESLQRAVKDLKPTHVFLTTWMRQTTESANIRVNGRIIRNLLDAVALSKSVRHVALVTGLKHYLGPFEAYGQTPLQTPFRETQPRLDVENFYYAQEDEVFRAAEREGFTWSIHRPHTIIGYALGNAMNMGVTLAVYASICKEQETPFRFPGSNVQWNGVTDMTDARLLARHLVWASTTAAAQNEAFNVANGDVFRWKWMWNQIADWFGVTPGPVSVPLEKQMADAAPIWSEIARKYNLFTADLSRLVSPWHTDADLGRPIEVITDMSKSRKLGFLDYQPTDESFFDLFSLLRQRRVIP